MTRDELKTELLKFGFPQMMFTRNTQSFIGYKISEVTKGFYNHFCWLRDLEDVASQDMTFHTVPLNDYLTDSYVVKFVTDTRWGFGSKLMLQDAISDDLKKPFYRRLYDPLAIFGQWSGLTWIQNPLNDICSDKASYLKLTDPKYNLKHPDPADVNRYQKEQQACEANHFLGYKVTARWEPEDY